MRVRELTWDGYVNCRPLVVGFVTQLDQQIDQIGLDRATRDRLRDLLLDLT